MNSCIKTLKISLLWKVIFISAFTFSSVFVISKAAAQSAPPQIKQPAFLQSDEEAKEIINGQIYSSQKKGQPQMVKVNGKPKVFSVSKIESSKFYFSDGQGKVLKIFNVFPSQEILNAQMSVRHTKKYLVVRRSFSDGGKNVSDGFILDNSGQVLWHIPGKAIIGDVFANDKNDNVIIVDAWKGFLKVYTIKGVEKIEKYFTDQNDKRFSDLALENLEDVDFRGGCESSENGDYIAVFRSSSDFKEFQSELTLLDSDGNIIFQNRAPQSKVGSPIKIFGDLKIIFVSGEINGRLTDRKYKAHQMYFGLDFTGNELWNLDGEKYFINRFDLIAPIVKVENVERDMDESGKHSRGNKFTPSNKTFNLKTGELK